MRLFFLLLFLSMTFPVWAQEGQGTSVCSVDIVNVQATVSPGNGQKPDDASPWEDVSLPDSWNARHAEQADNIWYRINWRQDCTADSEERVALLLRSIIMAGEVYINGHFLWRDDQLVEPLSRSWNMPRYWLLPDAWLNDGLNTILIRVVGVKGQTLGLGPVELGEARSLHEQYENLWWRNRTLYTGNIIVSGVIGILFFCIWFVRRDQTAYGWYAFSSLFWVVFISNTLVTKPWPWPDTLTAARVNAVALMLSIACFCMFVMRFGQLFHKRYERALWLLTGAFVIALFITPQAYLGYFQLGSLLVGAAFFVLNCLQFPLYAFRTQQREHMMLAVCLLVLVITTIHDILLVFQVIPGDFTILPYANIVITLSLSGILGLRHAHNVRRIEQFNVELAESVNNARSELATTLEREYSLALYNTRLKDRLEIAHDLHDGLGGSLVHMMASIEQGNGPVNRSQVVSMLKLIRDDLRQTIDSNSSPSIRVPATPLEWIAPLRHRFTALFDELDISAQWIFPDHWGQPPSTLQCLALTRVIEEALTNVIKHSRAQRVSVRLEQHSADALLLQIEDDGIGFDVSAVQLANMSIGTRSMSMRIMRVGGHFSVTSLPGKTIVSVLLRTEPQRPTKN